MKHCQTAFDSIFPELIKRGKTEDTDSPSTCLGQAETWLVTVKPSLQRGSCGDEGSGATEVRSSGSSTICPTLLSNYTTIRLFECKLFFHPKDIFFFLWVEILNSILKSLVLLLVHISTPKKTGLKMFFNVQYFWKLNIEINLIPNFPPFY